MDILPPWPGCDQTRKVPRLAIIGVTFLILAALLPGATDPVAQSQTAILVFSKTLGFRHDSIPDGIAAMVQLGLANGFVVDATEDGSLFNDANLARYRSVVFLSTTGDVLDATQQAAFERYLQNGGGFVGIHSASDTEYGWPWYGGLVGAYFQGHPDIQPARVRIEDRLHPSTSGLPAEWDRTDEWYNFQTNPRGRVKVLADLDEKTYVGGTMGADHPIAWCQFYGGGRAWYTAGGHTTQSYSEPLFRLHLLGAIQFAAGLKEADCSALSLVSSASFAGGTLAGESIASVFGTDLNATSLRIRDSAGKEGVAQLLFVSPAQINFVMPPGLSNGNAILTLFRPDGTTPSSPLRLAAVAPGLFTADANGKGPPAGISIRVAADNSQVSQPLAEFEPSRNGYIAAPIDLGSPSDKVFLVLFGTGFRHYSASSAIAVTVGGEPSAVSFAGPQGAFAGLDQLNVLLPRNLAGRGEVEVAMTVDGITANLVLVHIK
jgi:uncharacterized protein (TIGR03437 family)